MCGHFPVKDISKQSNTFCPPCTHHPYTRNTCALYCAGDRPGPAPAEAQGVRGFAPRAERPGTHSNNKFTFLLHALNLLRCLQESMHPLIWYTHTLRCHTHFPGLALCRRGPAYDSAGAERPEAAVRTASALRGGVSAVGGRCCEGTTTTTTAAATATCFSRKHTV